MTQLLEPALAFYVRHFHEAEAIRELEAPPPEHRRFKRHFSFTESHLQNVR